MLKSFPRSPIPEAFRHREFLRKLIRRKTRDRFIPDRRPPIPFRHRRAQVYFRTHNLKKVPTPTNTHELSHLSSMPRVFSRLEKPYGLVLPRVILGSLGPSHTSESVFPRQHCTMKSIGVRGFSRRISTKTFMAHPRSPIHPLRKRHDGTF
jgi:hypothetical protein